MKIRGSSARAWDLVEHIEECIELAKQDKKPSFAADLRSKLVKRTLDELHTGRIENFGFEYIVKDVLDGLGAFESEIVPRKKDQGVDICATFQAAGFDQYVCVQAKHYKKDPPIGSDVVYELIRGIEEWRDPVAMGMVITSGTFNDEAEKVAEKYEKDNDLPIKLLDGDWLAGCIVDLGLQAIPYCAS